MKKAQPTHVQLIQRTVQDLDWQKIHTLYTSGTLCWSPDGEHPSQLPSLDDLQEELRSVLRYVLADGLTEFHCGHWLVRWYPDRRELEVVVAPLKFLIVEQQLQAAQQQPTHAEQLACVEQALTAAVAEERYEYAAKLRDELLRLRSSPATPLRKARTPRSARS